MSDKDRRFFSEKQDQPRGPTLDTHQASACATTRSAPSDRVGFQGRSPPRPIPDMARRGDLHGAGRASTTTGQRRGGRISAGEATGGNPPKAGTDPGCRPLCGGRFFGGPILAPLDVRPPFGPRGTVRPTSRSPLTRPTSHPREHPFDIPEKLNQHLQVLRKLRRQ